MRKPIEEKIKQLNINDRVLMVGQQKNPEEWLRALDIFCLPSYANEGVPQAIIQAMLSEIAIISTPIGAINEIITDGHSGLLVTPRNSKQLAYAIKKLSQDIALMTKLSATARTYAFDRLQLERMINKMEALFYQSAGIRKIQK
jgi:glycosyltransferase involved in cell wall biosynthesis